jgi:hypothetical protein
MTATGLVPAEEYCRPAASRSALPAPHLLRDDMPPVQSMATGRIYDSKSAIRAEYKRLNLVEVGNDIPTTPPPRPRPQREDVRAAVGRAFSKAGLGA